MTPNMGMAAPKGTQAPQAGLAAIAQPAQAPKGMTSGNMAQIMATARKMSDAQLAEVLQGKSLDVPQYVAMTEAMGRKQLRTAVQGAQAMGQTRQPSLKDKLMAEEAGLSQLAQMPQEGLGQAPQMMAGGGAIDMNETAGAGGIADLPAPNMEPMTMAAGGIVAFDEGGDVEARNPLAFLNPGDLYEKLKNYISEKQAAVPDTPLQAKLKAEKAKNMSPAELDAVARGQGVFPEGSPALPGAPAVPAAPAAPTLASAPSVAPKKSGLETLVSPRQEVKNSATEDYLAKLAEVGAKQREGLAAIRSQGGGEALMQLASGLLSSPTLAGGLAKGMPLVASTSAASRKEQRDLEKTANDYDLNVAKARAAMAEGDKDRALKYMQLANEDKYHMAMVNKPDSGIAMLNALRDPANMALFKEMNAAKRPTDVVSRDKALAQWEDLLPNAQKKYGTFENYYNTINNVGGGGGGLDLSAAARAELERRSKQ